MHTQFKTVLFKPALLAFAVTAGLWCVAPLAAAADAAPAPADAKDGAKGTLLHPKVDKPISDTYKSLDGTRYEDRDEGTDQIRDSWTLKNEQKEQKRAENHKVAEDSKDPSKGSTPLQKDIRIQEMVPDAPAGSKPATPAVEKDKDSLRIHDQ